MVAKKKQEKASALSLVDDVREEDVGTYPTFSGSSG